MPIPHTIRHCSLLVAMVLVACEKPSEAPEQSNTAAQSAATTPCTRSLNIFLAPLQDEAATATLRFAKDAKGDLQCADVNIGEKAVRLMPGESTTISTHATDLQRIYIRKQRLLVYIAPGSTIEFGATADHRRITA